MSILGAIEGAVGDVAGAALGVVGDVAGAALGGAGSDGASFLGELLKAFEGGSGHNSQGGESSGGIGQIVGEIAPIALALL